MNTHGSVVGSAAEVPLSSFFPGAPHLSGEVDPTEATLVYQPQTSTLPNGVKVISTVSTRRRWMRLNT